MHHLPPAGEAGRLTAASPSGPLPVRSHRRGGRALLGLAAVAVALVFALPGDLVLSGPGTDAAQQFLAARAFTAEQFRAGEFPLWNPYVYSGQPFLAGFQSALLYPPTLLFAILPLAPAMNLSYLLHLLLLGWGMERWARARGLDRRAAWLCGLVLPLSGPVISRLFAGHLTDLGSMAWTPWIFLGLERWWRDGRPRGLLLASAAACLQILAGHVQYVFFAAIAAGLHALVTTFAEPAARRRALPGVAAVYAVAAALGAAQLWPGLAALDEGLRDGKLDFGFVSMFSLPPENLLTLVAPGFFGDMTADSYWGRCFLWEMSLFVGVVGLLLAAVALADRGQRRRAALDLGVAGLLLALALGAHTPLLRVLYDWVPGFGSFRGMSKFTFPALLFLVLALGAGADALGRGRLPGRVLLAGALAGGLGLLGCGLWFWRVPGSLEGFIRWIPTTHETYLPEVFYNNMEFLQLARVGAGQSLVMGGATLLAAVGSLFLARRRAWLRWAPAALLAAEMAVFAGGQISASRVGAAMPEPLRAFVAARPGDYRVCDVPFPNNGFFLGAPDVWGDNPGGLRRYAEFMAFSQGQDPAHATQYLEFARFPRVYAMLRFRYAFVPRGGALLPVEAAAPPLGRVRLLTDYRVVPERPARLAALLAPDFEPRRTVLLETEPSPRPDPAAAPGRARVLAGTTDALEIEADCPGPALLLITDPYSRDWRADPLPNSAQAAYEILPANHVLRAVPLAAGHHHFLVEYAPPAFARGLVLGAAAWTVWLGLAWRWRRRATALR